MKRLSIKNLSKKKKIILAAVLLLLATAVVYAATRDKTADVVEEITQPNKKYYSQLTGMDVDKDALEEPILAVMIENSEEARPQAGLDSAGIVFETVTEAGITRYLLLFQENKPEQIGPVRSVRPAYVDWAMGFDASIAHVGGSEQALKMIEDRNYDKDMNEFAHADSFFRRADKEAPHDAYAKSAVLVALQKELEHKVSEFPALTFADGTPANPSSATVIALQFSHPVFGATFTYDTAANAYKRSLAGAPHVDENTGEQITVKNLIVFKQDIQSGATGSGEATLYNNGTTTPIRWEQKSYSDRITFKDLSGNDVTLNRGDTWIAVLPPTGTITIQ